MIQFFGVVLFDILKHENNLFSFIVKLRHQIVLFIVFISFFKDQAPALVAPLYLNMVIYQSRVNGPLLVHGQSEHFVILSLVLRMKNPILRFRHFGLLLYLPVIFALVEEGLVDVGSELGAEGGEGRVHGAQVCPVVVGVAAKFEIVAPHILDAPARLLIL